MHSYRNAAIVVAVLGLIGGIVYGRSLGISGLNLGPMLFAFLVEAIWYLSCGFEHARRAWPKWMLAASAVIPYGLYTLPLGIFALTHALAIGALASAVIWWFDFVPRRAAPDLLLMVFLAAVYLSRVFHPLYPDLHDKVPMSTLGHLMWVRLALITLLNRNPKGIGFRFLPDAREWRIGALYFVAFLPAGAALMAVMNYGDFHLARGWWYKAALGFLGGMLLVAASEEIVFRGVLQRRFSQWWGDYGGWLAASAVFGLVHLPFRGFPNWQHVALTFLLALFLGRAYVKGGSVGAPMVAHALTIAAGRAIGL